MGVPDLADVCGMPECDRLWLARVSADSCGMGVAVAGCGFWGTEGVEIGKVGGSVAPSGATGLAVSLPSKGIGAGFVILVSKFLQMSSRALDEANNDVGELSSPSGNGSLMLSCLMRSSGGAGVL